MKYIESIASTKFMVACDKSLDAHTAQHGTKIERPQTSVSVADKKDYNVQSNFEILATSFLLEPVIATNYRCCENMVLA